VLANEMMGNNQRNKLGKKIKALHRQFEPSQDKFARKVNVPYGFLTKIEIVVNNHPSL
jgi:DNA-binding transcriptional regulator YiaG